MPATGEKAPNSSLYRGGDDHTNARSSQGDVRRKEWQKQEVDANCPGTSLLELSHDKQDQAPSRRSKDGHQSTERSPDSATHVSSRSRVAFAASGAPDFR